MDRKQRIDHYLQKISDKNFEIYTVRRELEEQHVEEDEIKAIVRAVDEELQRRLLTSHHHDQSSGFIRIGLIFMLIGAGIAIAAYTGVLNIKSFILLTYGPLFVGLSMLLVGLFRRRSKNFGKPQARDSDESNDKKIISFRRKPD